MGDQDFININLDEVDDGSDPIPAGLRLCRVKSAERKHKEGSEYPYIDVRLNPLDVEDKFQRRILFLTLSFHPNALWNMKRFMKAAQIEAGAKGFHLEDFPGKEVFVTVVHEPDRNDPSLIRASVSPPYSKAS